MCTALSFNSKDHYFGRNLDLNCSYGEEICIMPRKFPLEFRQMDTIYEHYAMIGMATVVDDVPLFYDATNEYGLSMAGLNFPGNAYYYQAESGKDNITPFEFIPWILGRCKDVNAARKLLNQINLVNIRFSDKLPLSPLHWIISDKEKSIVVEVMEEGFHVYDNPLGILTNNPPFPYHMFNLNNYRGLSSSNGENTFSENLKLDTYCQGLGSIGLPGDVSSMSRFVRMAFNKENSICEEDEISSVSQFFHLLTSVEMTKGACMLPNGEYDITVYSSCVNTDRGLYYYTTYDNRQIRCVDMHKTDLNGTEISRYPLATKMKIEFDN